MTVLYNVTDPCTDYLLDFIAQHESAGNYNAVIGDAHAIEPLDKLTFDEVYQLMDNLRRTEPSTAVGRYQIISATLEALQERAHLPISTKFTPEVQDRFAWMLLCRRGYHDWWVQHITLAQFTHNLSLEWASLPDPFNHGKSHYDGIGPNYAGCSVEAMYATIHAAYNRRGIKQ